MRYLLIVLMLIAVPVMAEQECQMICYEVPTCPDQPPVEPPADIVWFDEDIPKPFNWYSAKSYCADNGGRLPTLEELKTQPFQWVYWSGDEYNDYNAYAWRFDYVYKVWKSKSISTYNARCVR